MRAVKFLKLLFKPLSFLWRLIYQNRNAKIRWLSPQKSRILVFHADGLKWLLPLFGEEPYEVIYTSGEQLYFSPRILGLTLLNLTRVYHPLAAYTLALIQRIQPAIVITFIDNSQLFGMTAEHYHQARFLAIQNGIRCLVRDFPPGTRPIYLPEFACFGQHEVDMYTRHGTNVGRFYPIGSLKDSYYRESNVSKDQTIKFDLCLVSEFEPTLAKAYPEIEGAIKKLAVYIAMFCEKRKKTLCVAARTDPDENPQGFLDELYWYRMQIGNGVNLVPNKHKEFTTYQLIDSSVVSLSFYSTALLEAFGRGKRSLFCNFSNNDLYELPVTGQWYLGNCSYDEFEERLLSLLEMTDRKFQEISLHSAIYVMDYKQSKPSHTFLRELVAEAITNRCS